MKMKSRKDLCWSLQYEYVVVGSGSLLAVVGIDSECYLGYVRKYLLLWWCCGRVVFSLHLVHGFSLWFGNQNWFVNLSKFDSKVQFLVVVPDEMVLKKNSHREMNRLVGHTLKVLSRPELPQRRGHGT